MCAQYIFVAIPHLCKLSIQYKPFS